MIEFLKKSFLQSCRLIITCVIALSLFAGFSAVAQTITPAQLEQLKDLTPAQKKQLIEMLGGGQGSTASKGRPQTAAPRTSLVVPVEEAASNLEERLQFKPMDFMVVEMIVEEKLRGELLEDVSRSLGRNVYQLDSYGRLDFPGAGSIVLSGLTEQEVELRLTSEPALHNVEVLVSRLPVTPTGNASLEPFGYDLFQGVPTTFAPVTDIPVPAGYVLGVSDELSLLIFGQHNASYDLVVGRDGNINVPEIGPFQVAGLSFEQVREELTKRVESRYIGVDISLTLGELKTIQIFILGDVNRPGSYTVSGLSTMTNALFVSGGISTKGSLRNVQLKRRNKVVGTLDLYDLLLSGNTRGDLRLQPGDAIFVPPVSNQVSIFGQVNRPAIYELSGESTVTSVIRLAGGLLPDAYQSQVRVEKYDNQGRKSILAANVSEGGQVRVGAGDQIEVLRALDQVTNAVYLKGHVYRENTLQWHSGLRLLDLLPSADVFRLQSDQHYLLIRRVNQTSGEIQLLNANWLAARNAPASEHNHLLQEGDTVHVFSLDADRAAKIAPFVNELRLQANSGRALQTVVVHGRVRSPGEYPYQSDMRVSDLLRAAGGIRENAFLDNAELTRTKVVGGQFLTNHQSLSLKDVPAGSGEDELLIAGDVLTVKAMPLWREKQLVEILGEVEFPGFYSVSRGERLSNVIARAGGVTNMAFAGGSVFLREDLRVKEQEQIAKLARRVRVEVNSFGGDRDEERSRAEALLEQLEESSAMGRLVIDLNLAMTGNKQHDVVLDDGDKLVIPELSQEVTVIGEVQYPTSHIYDNELDQFAYIYKSGGVTPNADMKRIYVIRADGQVVAHQGSNWFRRSGLSIEVGPGDTIVVPIDADRISKLSLWTSATRIMYNIGVAAAAVASF